MSNRSLFIVLSIIALGLAALFFIQSNAADEIVTSSIPSGDDDTALTKGDVSSTMGGVP